MPAAHKATVSNAEEISRRRCDEATWHTEAAEESLCIEASIASLRVEASVA